MVFLYSSNPAPAATDPFAHTMSDIHAYSAALLAIPRDAVLAALLAAAAVIDWRTYRIPNCLTVGGMALGLLGNTAADGLMSGLLPALAGLALGIAVLLPLYALRLMGAGDVKLMAAVGAFVGVPEILYAVLFTFIAGGIAALAFAAYRGALRRMAGNVLDTVRFMAFAAAVGVKPEAVAQRTSIGRLPYGGCIAAGTVAWLAARHMGYA
jgi:prepilin peptidase CpaA